MATSVSIHPKNLQIPIDLFVNKKHFKKGDLGFIDSDDSSVYRVNRQPSSESSSSSHKRVLFDAAGVPLFSMIRKRVSLTFVLPIYFFIVCFSGNDLLKACRERNEMLSSIQYLIYFFLIQVSVFQLV